MLIFSLKPDLSPCIYATPVLLERHLLCLSLHNSEPLHQTELLHLHHETNYRKIEQNIDVYVHPCDNGDSLKINIGFPTPKALSYPVLRCRRKPSPSRRERSSYLSISAPQPQCRTASAMPVSLLRLTGTASHRNIHGC